MLNLDQDFIFLENPRQYPFSLFPYRTRHLIATLCLKGSATGEINLRKYEVSQDGFILILPGQIVESASLSEDFEGKVLMMSQRFTDSLDIIGSFSLTSAVERHPYFIFPKEAIDTIKAYMDLCSKMMGVEDTARRMESLRLISKALFLGLGSSVIRSDGYPSGDRASRITSSFLEIAQ